MMIGSKRLPFNLSQPLGQTCQILVGCFLSKLIDVLPSHLFTFPSIGGELPKLVLTPHILNVKRCYSKQSYFVEKKRKLEKPWAVASSCLAWGLR